MNKNEAEKQITEILKQLEIDQKCYVKNISIDDVEITNINDDRPVFSRKVVIDSKQLPGENWSD